MWGGYMGLFLYLLRHGETTASLTGEYCGVLDPELTHAGFQMAEDFVTAYSALPWTALYSSPLRRAMDTAEPISEKTGLKLCLQDELREIDFGNWEGKSPEEVDREFHDEYLRWLTDPGWNAPTGGQNGFEIARSRCSETGPDASAGFHYC